MGLYCKISQETTDQTFPLEITATELPLKIIEARSLTQPRAAQLDSWDLE